MIPLLSSLSRPTAQTALRSAFTRQFPSTSARLFSSTGRTQSSFGKGSILQALRQQGQQRSAAFNSWRTQARRTLLTDSAAITRPVNQADSWKRFGVTAAVVAGSVVLVQGLLNRETRDGLSATESSYLNDAFKYTGGGLVLTAVAARALFRSGFAYRLMATNPWVVLGVSLVGSVGSMMGVMYTSPENSVQKHLFWLAFNGCQAATLSPMFFFAPAILSRAALYTCGVVGSLSYVGATAKNDTYLYMGGPLLAGVTVVALSSLAPMALPLGTRALAISEFLSLYGGLAVFGGFVLFDTQKILRHARMVEAGHMKPDPLRESVSLELDMINIFIRLVQILAMRSNNRK